MQNSNPSRSPFSPSLLQNLLERTLFGARPAPGDAPTPGGIPAAHTAPAAVPADDDTSIDDDADPGDAGDPGATSRFDVAELLGVLRDPITWVFTLAERHAQGDPVDIAVIHRVRDAVLHRVNASIDGVPPDESRHIRSTDLVTLFSHLVGTLDPRLVQRAMQIVGAHIAEVFTAGLAIDASLADVGHAATSEYGPDVPPTSPAWYLGASAARPVVPCSFAAGMPYPAAAGMPYPFVPYGGHYGAPYVASFAAPHVLRPAVPPWSNPFAFPY